MFPHVCMFHKKSWVLASYLCRLYYNGLFKNLPLLLFVGDICFFVCRPVDHAVSVLTDMWGSSSGRLNQDAINQIPFIILSNIHSFGCSTKRVEFSLLIFADCIIMAFLKSSFTLICRWYMFFLDDGLLTMLSVFLQICGDEALVRSIKMPLTRFLFSVYRKFSHLDVLFRN
jgi:hypothetical protein